MRKFINIVSERYTTNNSAFLRYMQNANFDPYNAWHAVCKWLDRNDYLETMSELVGEPIEDSDELMDHDPDIFFKLPADVQKECGEWATEWLMNHDPGEAPTHAHMHVSKPKLLNRLTWLVHFSDHALDISLNGFKYGVDQMDKLGLTTYLGDNEKKICWL